MPARAKKATKATTKVTEQHEPIAVEAPTVDKIGKSHTFKVSNLSLSTTEDCFHFFCLRHFKPTSCNIERDQNKRSTGSGYFTVSSLSYSGESYTSPSSYIEAINAKHIRLDSKSLYFIHIETDTETVESGDQFQVEYLPTNTTPRNVFEAFNTLGNVTDVRITLGARNAAVRFIKNDKVYESGINEVTINEKKLAVKRISLNTNMSSGGSYSKREGIRNEQKVFIYDYDETLNKEEVEKYFGGYGEVIDVMMVERDHPEKGKHRFGFVSFKDENIASQLIEKGSHVIEGKTLLVKSAINKGNRGYRSGYNNYSNFGGRDEGYKRVRRGY